MPCNSDHMRASDRERSMSRVFALLDELEGRWEQGHKPSPSAWDGYHKRAYNAHSVKAEDDQAVAYLCGLLQASDVSQYSLEMQAWWRDHQEEDRERIRSEMRRQTTVAEKAAAVAKLTPYERRLLGLEN